MWVLDLGLALRVRPGMTQSLGADCSAPGISPCPFALALAGVTAQVRGRLHVPLPAGPGGGPRWA
eukprot:826829-Prymnesium_polylepis.2